MDNYLGNGTWSPNGFINAQDEHVQNYPIEQALVVPTLFYAYHFPFDGRQNGDEMFGGNSYQYIPTELSINTALTMRNAASAGEFPLQDNPPGMTQLLQSLYQKMSSFWQSVRSASGTGWGS